MIVPIREESKLRLVDFPRVRYENRSMSPRLELWLVRHGQTTANASQEISGWTDVSLTPEGEAQAAAVRPLLEGIAFDSVWSSDLKRAVATARLAHGEPRTDRRLREMHFGRLEGRGFEEIEPIHRDTLMSFCDFEPPGGERMEEFRERLVSFISTLAQGRHLLFTHGGVIRALTSHLGEDRFVRNGGLVGLDWTAGRILFVKEAEA